MELTVVLFVLNFLLGFVMYLLKNSHDSQKAEIGILRERQNHFQDNYAKREDLREIKQDIQDRLDRFERNIKQWLNKT